MPDKLCNHIAIEDRLRSMVKNTFKDFLYEYTVEISKATKSGDGFLGLIYGVIIDGYDAFGNSLKYQLILKLAPFQVAFRNVVPVREVYEREIFIYNEIIPKFREIQESKKLAIIFQPYPKFYTFSMDNFEEGLVMDDVRSKGFKIGDHRAVLDYPHALLIMRELGKFHALSYAIRDQRPEIFKSWESKCKDCFFNSSMGRPILSSVLSLGRAVLNSYDSHTNAKEILVFGNFLKNLPNVFNTILSPELAENYAVINHGDVEMRNILFKYANPDEPNIPTELCMIDWQLSRLGSPALDILFFILMCSEKELRERYYTNLIQEYYQSLSMFLRQLGSEPQMLLPYEILLNHLKKFAGFGLYAAIWLVATNMKDCEDVPDFYISVNEEILAEQMAIVPNDGYIQRIRDIVTDLIEYGYDF
ncbi:hypothetical protein RI129_008571 [Pyrocoelia pectoralis]|uniref:CHK kinase-like domain-containing protein n=1 Tax=Pyrocoelia pectoralis TaxID=417401 RepID=A0AAN7VEE0_9COLE